MGYVTRRGRGEEVVSLPAGNMVRIGAECQVQGRTDSETELRRLWIKVCLCVSANLTGEDFVMSSNQFWHLYLP